METTPSSIPDDLQRAVDDFDSTSDALLKQFELEVEAKPIPKFCFHYTDDRGLAGILEDGTIRLCDVFHQNDPSELQHGLSTASVAIRSRISDDKPELVRFESGFERFRKNGGVESSAHYFVCSFSAESDDLGQWRAYANDGHGFALGFATDVLEKSFVNSNPQTNGSSVSTFPITYDDDKLNLLQRELVGRLLVPLKLSMKLKSESEIWNQYMALLSSKYSVKVLMASILFKHSAYRNENEYRFLQVFVANQPIPGLKFIRKPSVLKGYRDFNWRNSCPRALRKIVIGPATDRAKATRFVGDCLRAFVGHRSGVDIEYSTIPYRTTSL